jgi:polysaccharide biosynthesis/export protein
MPPVAHPGPRSCNLLIGPGILASAASHGRSPSPPLAALALVCCLTLPAGAQQAEPAAAAASGYRLRAGDAVRLYVQDEPTLAGEFPVLEDGTVLLPLIGVVRVTDAEFGTVSARVRAAYAAEFVDLAVVVQPLVRVRVLGEVRVPGLYLVDATFDLEDVLARAGGLAPSAAARRVRLLRGGREYRFDVRNGATVPSGFIRPGDEIVVPRRSWLGESMPLLIGAGASVLAAALTALVVR